MSLCDQKYPKNPNIPEYIYNIWETVPEGSISSRNIVFPDSLPFLPPKIESKETIKSIITSPPISPTNNIERVRYYSDGSATIDSPRRRGKRAGKNCANCANCAINPNCGTDKPMFYYGQCNDWNIIGRYGYINGIICHSQDIVNADFIQVGQYVLYQLQYFSNNSIKCINVFVK